MSYEEKGTWVYLVVAIVGSTVYLSLVLPAVLAAPRSSRSTTCRPCCG